MQIKVLRLIFFFIFSLIAGSSGANQSKAVEKPESLKFVQRFTDNVLIENYKKQLLNRILEKKPEYKIHREVVVKWLDELMKSGEFEQYLAARYKTIFTEDEFAELNKFYSSQTGLKFLKIAPKMSTMSATVAGQVVYQKLNQLDKVIQSSK